MFTKLMTLRNGLSLFTRINARLRVFAAVIATLSFTACADGIEGFITDVIPDTPTQITFWTTDSSPSAISIELDGRPVGVLTAYRTVAPGCGASNTGGIVTISVSPGAHTITAREVTDTGHWPATSVTVVAGECRTFRFDQ